MNRLDLVVTGVGGQGVVTLASVLVRGALRQGRDAHFLVHSGLSQLGAPVMAHVRLGDPAGPSPKVPRGGAHLVVGMERLESLRLAAYLSARGTALLSDEPVRPYEARFRSGRYPSRDEVAEGFAGAALRWIPASEIARRHGPPALVSAVMLGALAASTTVVSPEILVDCLRERQARLARAEEAAFFDGYRVAEEGSVSPELAAGDTG